MVSGRNQRGRKDRYIGPPDAPLFYAGRAAKDAVLAPVFGKYLVIALSHGTGGSAMQMAWLGTYLAARGFHCRRRQSSRQQRGHRVHNAGLYRRLAASKRH